MASSALHVLHGTEFFLFFCFHSCNTFKDPDVRIHWLLNTVDLIAHQAAMDAVCGATSAEELLAHNALLPAWKAAGSTLQYCCEVIGSRCCKCLCRNAPRKAAHLRGFYPTPDGA
jgi:hypothetical protein